MKITLKGIGIVGASVFGGMLLYECILRKACEMGLMYRSFKRMDGAYHVYGDIDAIDPIDRERINAAQAGVPDE